MATKIQTVLAVIGESTTIREIEKSTGFNENFVRYALGVLRGRDLVVRLNEGCPNRTAAIFAQTQAGRDVLAGAVSAVRAASAPSVPAVPLVHQAIAKRPALATVWMGA